MKKQKETRETVNFNEKEWYRERIIEMVGQIENIWILGQIVKFIENITK